MRDMPGMAAWTCDNLGGGDGDLVFSTDLKANRSEFLLHRKQKAPQLIAALVILEKELRNAAG
ncbi:MAG: hypothetical protein ACT4OU_07685 [Hyphomicrobium sp.]